MHLTNNRLFSAASVGLGLVMALSSAAAQQASFTLPFEVHVGSVTLQPGDYRIKAPSASSPIRAIYLYGNGKVQATLPSAIDSQDVSDSSYLELVNAGGTYFVRKFTSGVTGESYTFSVPKQIRRETLANTHLTTIAVTGGTSN